MATVTEPLLATEVPSPAETVPPATLLDYRHRITVKEFHRIVESGALGPEPRVELLEGVPAYYAETRIFNEHDDVPLILDGREVARFPLREILP